MAKREQDWTIVLMSMDGKWLVRRRPKGLLGGLYEFVTVEGHPDPEALVEALTGQGFRGVRLTTPLADAKHVFTHLIWRMQGWRAACESCPDGFAATDDLDALAFPSALRVYRKAADDSEQFRSPTPNGVGDGNRNPLSGVQLAKSVKGGERS